MRENGVAIDGNDREMDGVEEEERETASGGRKKRTTEEGGKEEEKFSVAETKVGG